VPFFAANSALSEMTHHKSATKPTPQLGQKNNSTNFTKIQWAGMPIFFRIQIFITLKLINNYKSL
jgi:hypothetical protein